MVNQNKVIGTINDAMVPEDKQKIPPDKPVVLGIDRRILTELRLTGSLSIETFPYDGKTENGYNPDGYIVARYTSPDGRIIVQGNGSSHHWYAMESLRHILDSYDHSGLNIPRRTA